MQSALVAASFAILCGCSATVVKNPAETPEELRVIAVLPVVSEVETPRERTDALEESLRSELAAHGYTVVPKQAVSKLCAKKDCTAQFIGGKSAGYAEALGSDAVAQLILTSTRNANIFFARYTSVAGSLSLYNKTGKLITSVTDSQSQRGGLLFNTGQLVEGIKSTFSALAVSPYVAVSEHFVNGLVLNLPSPQGSSPEANEELAISKLAVSPLGDSRYRICVQGTKDSTVAIQLNKRQIPLRQISPGSYCNVVLLDGASTKVAAMLQSRLGASVSSQAEVKAEEPKTPNICLPEKAVTFEPGKTFKLASNDCKDMRFVIYRGATPAGPFQTLSTLGPQKSFTAKESSPVYAVVAVSHDQGASLPHVITNDK